MDIPKTMMAVVKAKKERGAEYREVPVPEVGPDEVLVKVRAAAICGTDIHTYQWNAWAQVNVEKAYSALPRIMGHEFSGDVVKIGSLVTNAKIGERVCCETHLACGECYQCRTGDSYNCQHIRRFKNGIYADYALVPAKCLVRIPDNMTYDQASVMEPFSVGTHAASKVRMVGEPVCIVGAGPIGLFLVKIAKAMGATEVYVTDISDYRLALAKECGADYAFDSSNVDVVEEIKKRTGGLGCGVVFDTSGNVDAIKQGFQILRKCGHMVMVGLPSKPLVLDASDDIVWKAATVHGIHGREIFRSWEISKGLIGNGVVDIDNLLTHRFKLSEFQKGFELAEQGLTGKVLFYPDNIYRQ